MAEKDSKLFFFSEKGEPLYAESDAEPTEEPAAVSETAAKQERDISVFPEQFKGKEVRLHKLGGKEKVTLFAGDFEYILLEDGTAEIWKYFGSADTVKIPAELEGRTVSTIGSEAFSCCYNLKTVTIPDSVTAIKGGAFASCGLTSVVIPDSVVDIDANPFYWCGEMTEIKVSKDHPVLEVIDGVLFNMAEKSLICYPNAFDQTSYSIPDGIQCIGDHAFFCCGSLNSITIPESVTNIGPYALYGCGNLSAVVLPDSITLLGEYAFSDCINLESVTIPGNVLFIGDDAFCHCRNLKSVTMLNGISSIGSEAFMSCYNLSSVVIPESVEIIGNSAFKTCKNLNLVNIPDSVIFIGDSTFESCDNLNRVELSDSITTIACSTFKYCRCLDSVMIPESVSVIGDSAFEYCEGLKSVTIPDGVTAIGNCVFDNCKNLKSVNIPDSVESIGDNAFSYCSGLINITIPDSVTLIGRNAFSSCRRLKTVAIPNSVISIGEAAFKDCESLAFVKLPDNVTSIGKGTFSSCTWLREVIIPDGVTSIGEHAFFSCTNLGRITLPDSVMSIEGHAFSRCDALKQIVISKHLKSIGEGAFYGCWSLKTILLPASVIFIDEKAFEKCSNLRFVVFRDTYAADYCRKHNLNYSIHESIQVQDDNGDLMNDFRVTSVQNSVIFDWSAVTLPEKEDGETLYLVFADLWNDYLNSIPAERNIRVLQQTLTPGRSYIYGFVACKERPSRLPEHYRTIEIPSAKQLTENGFMPTLTAVAEMPVNAKDGDAPEPVTEVTKELLLSGRAYFYAASAYETEATLPERTLLVTLTDPEGNDYRCEVSRNYKPKHMKEEIWYIPLTDKLTFRLDQNGYPTGEYRLAYYLNGELGDSIAFELK